MALEKGYIEPLEGNLKGQQLEVLFNPPEYTIASSNSFSEVAIPGLGSPLIQFTRGNIQTLTMALFFDTYTYKDGEDVRVYTRKVTDLLKIDPNLHAPPVCLFSWGELNFTCVIEQVSQRFTMFKDDGIPVRATLNVTFKEFSSEEFQARTTKQSSPDRTKLRTVKQGDSLWIIANREYGDPARWREIAEENKIENPRFLEPGTQITIPPLEFE